MNPIAQRLKDLSETDDDDDDEGLVRVALQKMKVVAPDAPTPKKAKKAQPIAKPKTFVLTSAIPCWINTRATKANPKIGDKEWAISFTRNKEDPALSSSDGESIDGTPITPLRKFAPTPQQCPSPSPLHLDRFKRATPRVPLSDAQCFLLVFSHGNHPLL